jgi:hypothetical protein
VRLRSAALLVFEGFDLGSLSSRRVLSRKYTVAQLRTIALQLGLINQSFYSRFKSPYLQHIWPLIATHQQHSLSWTLPPPPPPLPSPPPSPTPQVALSLAQQLADLHAAIQAQKRAARNAQQAVVAAQTTAPKPVHRRGRKASTHK